MRIDGAIQEVATELGLPFEVCKRAYLSSWEFVKATAQALPLKEDLTDEQFLQLRPNFNLPSLGKLFVTKDNYRRKKNKFLHIKELQKGNHGNNLQD